MKKTIKTIGKTSEKIGKTTVTGEGAKVLVPRKNDDIVAVRDYVTQKGYSGIVSWDGKNPTVGGIKITPTEIKDGISYAKKDELDNVISSVEKNAGIGDAAKERDERYKKAEDDAFNAVVNQKSFEYNPEDDVVYQSYKKQYEREAENALRRILNANNTSVTGASGAVLSDAMAAQYAELEKITDVIPELYENAYNRYTDESKMLNDRMLSIGEIARDYYNRLYNDYNDKKERISQAGEKERNERQRILENERQESEDIMENARKDAELAMKAEELKSDLQKNKVAMENTAMENAIVRGFFISSDETVMPWLKEYKTADGKYTITPSLAKVALEMSLAHAREKGKLNAKRGL